MQPSIVLIPLDVWPTHYQIIYLHVRVSLSYLRKEAHRRDSAEHQRRVDQQHPLLPKALFLVFIVRTSFRPARFLPRQVQANRSADNSVQEQHLRNQDRAVVRLPFRIWPFEI